MNAENIPMRLLARLALAASLCFLAPSFAGDGHDHSHDAPAPAGQASPRLDAHSDLFELVGVVDNGRMTVYLDRYGSNEPVTGARIEFESGAVKGMAQAQPDGTYQLALDALAKPGQVPFSFTVTAGADTDLLAGELVIPEVSAHEHATATPWARWIGITASVALLAFLALFAYRHFARQRQGAAA